MGLVARIERDGKNLPLRWGRFHVAAMIIASSIDSGRGPFTVNSAEAIVPGWKRGTEDGILITGDAAFTLFYKCAYGFPGELGTVGSYRLKDRYVFSDAEDGEELELKPGDLLVMHGG